MSQDGFIPLSEPLIKGKAWDYVKDCLDTGWVSSVGKYVDLLEQAAAAYTGRQYGIACVNGTAALHTALIVGGVKPHDEVIMPSLTFAAPAFAIKYVGAFPVFMDVENQYWQIDTIKLEAFLKQECFFKGKDLINKQTNRCVRAIMPVALLGHPANLDAVMKLAEKYSLLVIEDAAESLGASYRDGQKVGSKAHISCLSFNGNKIITAGGGGMLLTNNEAWAKQARYLTTQSKDDALEYIHHSIGYNYRLNNVQAALGLSQMEMLDEYVGKKKQIATRYEKALGGVKGITLPKQAPWADAFWWLYSIVIDAAIYGRNSRELLKALKLHQIQSRPLWHPLHSQMPFKDCVAYDIREANRLYEQVLSLPSSVSLTEAQQQKVIRIIQESAQGA